MNENRINDLEIRMTHLENYLNQLNDIVLENGKLTELIKKDQIALRKQMNEVSNEMPDPGAERPPHY